MKSVTPNELPYAEIPNDLIMSTARQYRDAVRYLYDRIQAGNFVLPIMANAALGIELYLKSLNARWDYRQDEIHEWVGGFCVFAKPLRFKHPLVELYDDLHHVIKNGLDSAYEANPVVKDRSSIRQALENYNDLFVSSRYPFEYRAKQSDNCITDVVELLDLIAEHVHTLPRQEFTIAKTNDS